MSSKQGEKISEIADYMRETHGLPLTADKFEAIFQDRGCVFHPVKMVYDKDPLKEGEFAYMHQADKDPSKGFMLYMHPFFKSKPNDLPFLVAYQLAVVNFGEEVSQDVAESFGAALMDMKVDEYYDKVNELFESIIVLKGCSL